MNKPTPIQEKVLQKSEHVNIFLLSSDKPTSISCQDVFIRLWVSLSSLSAVKPKSVSLDAHLCCVFYQ
jgi:hypothetical protein